MLYLLCRVKCRLKQINRINTIFFYLIIYPFLLFSQFKETVPFIKNYKPRDYNSATENWVVTQNKKESHILAMAKVF